MLEELLSEINTISQWAATVNGLADIEDESTQKYLAYINEHRENIGKAFHALYPVLKNYISDPLFFRLDIIEHDLSKYTAEEFEGYRQKYYARPGEETDEDMAEKAWVHHYMNNKHHPEYHISNNSPMTIVNILEMIIDWTSMSIKFKGCPYKYYKENKRAELLKNNSLIDVETIDDIFIKLEPLLKTLFPE